MREIKFRAWNLTENRFLTTKELIYRIEVEAKRQLRLDNNLISLGGKPDPSDEIIFQQYTGLKDKNGVEIYEGDLLVGHGLPIGETPAEVVFSDAFGGWALDGKFCGGYMCGTSQRPNYTTYEVVGNIFEGVDK